MGDRRQSRPTAEDVRAAIAGWQLRIQTDVKRTSSLPTSMFDACDPMLEAALADSAAHIFRRLMAYGPPEGYRDLQEERLRAESVAPQEIASLCVELSEMEPCEPPDLNGGSDLEHLWILLDLCLEEREPVRQRARGLLEDALGREVDVALVGERLLERLRELSAEPSEAGGETARQVQRLCEVIARRIAELRGGDPGTEDAP